MNKDYIKELGSRARDVIVLSHQRKLPIMPLSGRVRSVGLFNGRVSGG